MHVQVQPLPGAVDECEVAIVVDVLRATSVIAMAIEHNATAVVTCQEIDEARLLAACLTRPLLCGERFCQPIAGFDLGNSPSDYSSERVAGRSIVMTTTNGTRALAAAKTAKTVYAGAFVNLSAVATKLIRESSVTIVCAGTDGEATEEDILFAGALIAKLAQFGNQLTLDPPATAAINAWQSFLEEGVSLANKLSQSRGGRNLTAAGFKADIEACAQLDYVTAVPMMVARNPITLKRSPK